MPVDVIDFQQAAPVAGDLDVAWIHGAPVASRCTDPLLQVHAYDEHTVILRQSMAVTFEAPFLYLLFGNDRALLLDTGATADAARFPLRGTVDRLVADWLERHPRPAYELVVAHTHSHGDHVAGDGQLADRPRTTVVPTDVASVHAFWGLADRPDEVATFDLGGRVLEVLATPGHHAAHVTLLDPWSGFLLTGDSVYPGRIYVSDMPAFRDSLARVVRRAQSRPVSHVMGCHVEMTTRPGRDFPLGSTYHPDERPLPMTVAQLVALRDAVEQVADRPGAHTFDDVIVFNGPCRSAVVRQLARALVFRVRTRFTRRGDSP